MFGSILKIYDDHVIIENKSNVIDTNYLNLHVIFNDNDKKVVGEIINIERDIRRYFEFEEIILSQINNNQK